MSEGREERAVVSVAAGKKRRKEAVK